MGGNVTEALGDMLHAVLLFVPKALAFTAILVVGWLIAKAVRRVVTKLLERVGFDRAVERGGIKAALDRSSYDVSAIVAKIAFYAVMLFTVQLAFGIWGPNPISVLIAGVVAWLPKAFVAIVIVVVAAAIARAVKDLIANALGGLSYGRMLATIVSVFILGLGAIAALNQVGVATTVTTAVLITVLTTIAGVTIVGVGGGMIRPMQQRWEHWLNRAEQDSHAIAGQSRAYRAGRDAADAAMPVPPATEPLATQPLVTEAAGGRPGAVQATGAERAAGASDATQVMTTQPVIPPVARTQRPDPFDSDETQIIPGSRGH